MIKFSRQNIKGNIKQLKALFGGSFNPVHIGHLILARDILEDFGFEKILFIPAFSQPLKSELLIPPETRLEILKASIKGEKHFEVWDYEIKQKGISYTYKTLETYVKLHKEKPVFIMGYDSFLSFHKWKEPEKILSLSTLLIIKRPGYHLNPTEILKKLKINPPILETEKGKVDKTLIKRAKIIIYRGREFQVSATEIRNRLKTGKSIKYLVTEEAEKILWRWWKNAIQKDV